MPDYQQMPDPSSPVVVEQRIMHSMRRAVQAYVTQEALDRVKFDQYHDLLTDRWVWRAVSQVLGEKTVGASETIRFSEPASPWQHFKRNHPWPWLIGRWPVRYTVHEFTVSFDQWRTYPNAQVPTIDGVLGDLVWYEEKGLTGWRQVREPVKFDTEGAGDDIPF